MNSVKKEFMKSGQEDIEMADIYDFIDKAISRAEKEPDLVPVLNEVFHFCAFNLRGTDRKPKKVMKLDDWKEFFEHLRDVDRARGFNAMTKRSYTILNQLETMITQNVAFKRRLRLLLKRPLARKWFDANFEHVSFGAWERKT